MTMPSDDLAALFVQPDREHAGRAQGIVREWNPDTAKNVVEIHGTRFRNLALEQPLLTFSLQPGSVVMVDRWRPRSGRGSATYSISGQWLPPGEGRAQQAIAFLASKLAESLSAQVFAERVHQAFVEDADTLANQATFTDLDPPGPTIPDVEIVFGAAIVFVSCSMAGTLPAGAGAVGGFMGVAVAGATTVPAAIQQSFHVRQTNHNAGGTNRTDGALAASVFVVPLNPGTHTFTAEYRTLDGSSHTVSFSQRTLVVIGL